MARPKFINPEGNTHRVVAIVAEPTAEKLKQLAKERGVTIAQVIRDIIAKELAND